MASDTAVAFSSAVIASGSHGPAGSVGASVGVSVFTAHSHVPGHFGRQSDWVDVLAKQNWPSGQHISSMPIDESAQTPNLLAHSSTGGNVGSTTGDAEGCRVVGISVGSGVGLVDGSRVGMGLGAGLGPVDGSRVGIRVGAGLGPVEGGKLGMGVSSGVHVPDGGESSPQGVFPVSHNGVKSYPSSHFKQSSFSMGSA